MTLLGATGSIGASTIDLLKRERKRFRVEAVSANKNAAALAAAARELDARFAAIGDPDAYGDLKSALSGTGIKVAAGESGLMEAAERPAEWVIGAITGAAGLKPTLAAAERGAIVALANKETLVCAGGLFMRRAAAAPARGCPPGDPHRVGGPIPHRHCRGRKDGDRGASAQASQLVDGCEGDHRFGNIDEQRAGTY